MSNWLFDRARSISTREGGAAVFGIVLYTDAHANIARVLNDSDRWRAFDEEGGPRWAVFAARAAPGRREFPDASRRSLEMMIGVWKEPNENKQLLEDLELEDTSVLPALVVFALGADGQVWRKVTRLDDHSEDRAYNTLKNALREVRLALEKVKPENRAIPEGAFTAVSYRLKGYEDWQKLRKGLQIWRDLLSLKP